ncbi:uncharacterized protein LOC111313038 [Durio zibethinus]|uniref:Protein TILLER ANGLE CONTROL 1 n=1 Tax=Durio zibethinus TaxID=66656 RepID=A0A6P6AXN0_DURZI|nr:uncharacterized protein LOC111313038 [Durio zibethinus]
MKIFNWVQRRFHHNGVPNLLHSRKLLYYYGPILSILFSLIHFGGDGLARNVKKTDSVAIDTNTKALLQQVALVDVLDGWRDGILTIGTLGFDPLKSFSEQKDYLTLESDDAEGAEEERYSHNNDDEEDDNDDYDDNNSDEEVNPLMFSTFDHSFVDVDDHTKYGKPDVIMMVDGVAGSTGHTIKFDLDITEGHSGRLRRRTTLADLFNEDSDMKKKPSPLELESNSCTKGSLPTKNGLSFAKKLIPQVGEDSRPIKMLHQMRRMLKRKIHPELEGKSNKLDGQSKPSVIDVLASKKHEAGESVSLLQSPDAATA